MAKRLPSAPPLLSGYTYVRPLGTGGFADVFLFEQNMPSRSVAVKVALYDVVVHDDVLRSFNAEADVMAQLSAHPSILTVYTAGISADGRPYLVMEFCPGSYSSKERTQPLSVATVLSVAIKIAGALETAHRFRVLHRDIKPSNILRTLYNTPVLADFGIATAITGSASGENVFAMSLPWSAPEIVDERTTGTIATEVWSFGATIYSLLADRSPFESPPGVTGTREALKQRIRRARYTRTGRADAPVCLEDALASMMSLDPTRRPSSLQHCAEELQGVERYLGLPVTALDVADDAWASAGTAINFDNRHVQGAVIADVAVDSRRAGRVARPAVSSSGNDDIAPGQPRMWRATVPMFLVAGIVGAGVTLGVLLLGGLIA